MASLRTECFEALAQLELHIYQREGEYLERSPQGNVARGWEGFLDTRGLQKRRFDDRDRLFSFSSYSYTMENPQFFSHTRDDDPDNWCLELRRRTQLMRQASLASIDLSLANQSNPNAHEKLPGPTRKKRKQQQVALGGSN